MNKTVIKTGVIVGDDFGLAPPCVIDAIRSGHRLQWDTCPIMGIYWQFLAAIENSTQYQFEISVASEFGVGQPEEADTLFKMLNSGMIDVILPDYRFHTGRSSNGYFHALPIRATPTLCFYLETEMEMNNYGLANFLGCAGVAMVIFALIYGIVVKNVSGNTNLLVFKFINKGFLAMSFVITGIVLNLYASMLSIKLFERKATNLVNFNDGNSLVDALVKDEFVLVLQSNEEHIHNTMMMDTLFGRNASETLRMKVSKKIVYRQNYSQILDLVSHDRKYIAFLIREYLELDLSWPQYCRSVRLTNAAHIFPYQMRGMYVSRNSTTPDDVKLFVKYVKLAADAIIRMFQFYHRRLAQSAHSGFACDLKYDDFEFKPISVKQSWYFFLKPYFLEAFTLCVFVFVAENIFSYLRAKRGSRVGSAV